MQRDVFYTELNKGLAELSLCLSAEQKEQLFEYYSMVVEKNKVMNLTAITEEREFVIKHIIDSLSIVKLGEPVTDMLPFRLIDIGTGAGMPGVILKIAFPNLSVVLFDSLKKRLNFLDEVIEALSLKDIETLHGRAEDMGQDKNYRESFDMAVSRAVARLNVLSEYGLPFVKLGGAFVPYKSGDIAEELTEAKNAIAMLGGNLERDLRFRLPDSDMERSLLYIKKKKPTPKAYPRKAGVPSKKPIM
ncbi:MAG TPA: 16S rRNA (guanine(527)-N(7))-methyltransferase RsmG [Candidatus Avilachnospira avistercoris]|nr:16S rRNA (guanine(527)-N(7))-methyltransferase RsmG [Candidatus Avilachnospira avistercoris]